VSPTGIRELVVSERSSWVRQMLGGLGELPRSTEEEFLSDPRTPAAAESFLRRALEALLDLGRHILAKGFGRAAVEYKEIASFLQECGVLDARLAGLMRDMAGYRNRMVHYYDRVSDRELYDLARSGPADISAVLDAMLHWIESNQNQIDRS
jgi:uncharacterized protein YutE (UPF0331/DUF86 family)